MTRSVLRQLLPGVPATGRPTPYEVFGLDAGETDESTIQSAISLTTARVNRSKGTVEAEVWRQAAVLIKSSHAVLSHPQRKHQLDTQIQVSGDASSASDPLKGILPSADPLAPYVETRSGAKPAPKVAASESARSSSMPAGIFGTSSTAPEHEVDAEPGSADAIPAIAAPVSPSSDASESARGESFPAGVPLLETTDQRASVGAPDDGVVVPKFDKPASRSQRRRGPSVVGLFLGAFSMVLLLLICGLTYFLLFGPGQVQISSGNNGVRISTDGSSPQPTVVSPPTAIEEGEPATDRREREPRPRRDEVMGALAGDVPPPNQASLGTDLMPGSSNDMDQMDEQFSSQDAPSFDGPPTVIPPRNPTTADPLPASGSSVMPPSAMTPDPVDAPDPKMPATSQQLAAATTAIDQSLKALRDADWDQMKPLAQQAVDLAITAEQIEQANGIYQVADLGTYYHGAIVRTLGQLTVGSELTVSTLTMSVVEAGSDRLVLKDRGRLRTFQFNEFPPVLARALAEKSLRADTSTCLAAQHVYETLAPKSRGQYRDTAIQEILIGIFLLKC
ncbi:MAG: hypothetical protein AAGA03_17515 [Planctomycetota bacterium]